MTGLSLVISLSYECLGTLLISQHRSRYCRQVTNRYLNQCWSRSMSPYGVVKPQWVNFLASVRCGNNVKICIFKLIIRNTRMGIESYLILSYHTGHHAHVPTLCRSPFSRFPQVLLRRCHRATWASSLVPVPWPSRAALSAWLTMRLGRVTLVAITGTTIPMLYLYVQSL